jgi:hypothetical protein
MKELIKSFLDKNLEVIKSKSRLNCHIPNLHSIILQENPIIRLFVAVEGNELYKNYPDYILSPLSVGFHAHHCDLLFYVVKGTVVNWVVEKDSSNKLSKLFNVYNYVSAITKGRGSFVKCGVCQLKTRRIEKWSPLDGFKFLPARDLHTIAAPKGEVAAWLVYEKEEDPNYEPICYSDNNYLEHINFDELYRPIEFDYIMELLRTCDLV